VPWLASSQNDAALGEAVEQFSESAVVELWQGFGHVGDHLGQSPSA